MRFSKFKIKNFRSIIDSGWNTLSPDNITALIGQNESGKTSVIEALYSFHEGSISEDVLRSDLSLPEVTCIFTPESGEEYNFIDDSRMPDGVMASIKESSKLVLTRKWFPDLSSRIFLSGDNISEIFDGLENDESSMVSDTIRQIENHIDESEALKKEIARLEEGILSLKNRFNKAEKRQADLNKQIRRSSHSSEKEILNRNIEILNNEKQHITDSIAEEESGLNDNKLKLAGCEFLTQYAESCLELFNNFEKNKSNLEDAYKNVAEVEENMFILQGDREKKAGEAKLFKVREEYITISRQLESVKEEYGINIRLVRYLFANKEMSEAERNARLDYEANRRLFSREEAGEIFFRQIPGYEFFEDFSSLLPNRIDLEDIFENNNRVEGYKAVRNFLIIAGLDPEFFRQTNNRILKQKIENLNNEVTIDFQEYWRQNIGKTNKIRINFELEHYDTSHPEKKGRPYLEFWIKDQHERLYPKQRSRGVRWFLSFYLELKAFAKENHNLNRILLIDEPGLSLHARAQEDVLKVFEDIKGKIQIIYTTHSPNLIDHSKLYRLLAVQRAYEENEKSETIIFDASHLHSASSDTLSPICSIMGTGLTRQEFLRKSKNIIVEDIASFYYMTAINKLTGNTAGLYFLPANGPAQVSTLVNLLIGWGFEFAVLLFDNEENTGIVSELEERLQNFKRNDPQSRLQFSEKFYGPEDLFSTLDFKKFIIKQRVGISGSNFEFIDKNEKSRPLLAASFAQSVSSGDISIDNFDEETRTNLSGLFESLGKKIRNGDET